MAIAKSLFLKPVADAEIPKHKGLALLGFMRHHHNKPADVTVESASSSRRVTRKHKRNYAARQPPQLECSCAEQPHKQAKASVYDRCLSDAMKLKARLHRDNCKPATRFRLAAFKRVVVPPVSIPRSIAEHRGSKDFVGGHRVPFTRCMWETEKMRQQLVLRRLYMLPVLREDPCLEA